MAHVNLLKQVKIDDRWVLRSIPKKANGQRDWSALPEGSYFIEFREKGKRRRLPAGATVAQVVRLGRGTESVTLVPTNWPPSSRLAASNP